MRMPIQSTLARTMLVESIPAWRTEVCTMHDTFKAEIDKLRTNYEAAVATGDIDAFLPLLADGAAMVRPGSPEWEAMAAAAQGLPFPPGASIHIRPIEVVRLTEEWGYEFGAATTTYTPPRVPKR